jgi:inner membrane transporter RhtA
MGLIDTGQAAAPRTPAHTADRQAARSRPTTSPTDPQRRGGLGTGLALMATSSVSNQAGAAIGTLAFLVIGPVGVVAVRQFVTALALVPTVRPRLRRLWREHWLPICGLALVFSIMNLCLYIAIDRLGLGLAVVLEFLGPLAVAILSSRRRLDIACALVAAAGVVVLVRPGASTDVVGIVIGLIAACGWASYILLNRTLGQRIPGLESTAAASLVAAVLWVPIAIPWFVAHPPTPMAAVLAVTCGVLASAVPYASDLLALRRVPTHIFGTFTSMNPVIAALIGWLILDQTLGLAEWSGIALIVLSNAIVTSTGLRRRIAPA